MSQADKDSVGSVGVVDISLMPRPFEEYCHNAEAKRAREMQDGGGGYSIHILPRRQAEGNAAESRSPVAQERKPLAQAAQMASWLNVFYLITTDVLGPNSTPWAFSRLGYIPGVLLYFFFGIIAGYTAWQLWRIFLKLDSDLHPIKTYGDLAFRIYGPWARRIINILQSVQLLFIVGVMTLGNAQGLSQVVKGKACFSVLYLAWAFAGMLIVQIRTLRRFSVVANAAVWMNLLVVFITMGISARSAPNYKAAMAQGGVPGGDVQHSLFAPKAVGFYGQVVGLMQVVGAYSGAMLFCEFMSEMRRPWDFWKSLVCAQVLIMICYMTFGLFMYTQQGQFTINPANQGLSPYSWQTATNVISLAVGLVSAGLYANVGIKIIYHNVVRDMVKSGGLSEIKGRFLWAIMAVIYWAVAFVIGSAIPQFSNITGLVTAVCLLQFTYTLPPLLMLGFEVKQHAMHPREYFDPATGLVTRVDTFADLSRWRRAFGRTWYVKLLNLLLFLGALVCSVLGVYSSIKEIIAGFQGNPVATSFGCGSPVGA